jgi:predicted phosphodiesterase
MRVAVFADVHGNLPALEAVLAEIAGSGADLIVNLGDCASGPLWPREATERLANLEAVTVRGNHDRQVASVAPEAMGASDSFAYAQLSPAQRAWLGALPMSQSPAPGVLAFHAAPGRDESYLLDEIHAGRLMRAAHRDIQARLGAVEAKIVLCGHSHRPDAVQLPGGPLILNPGSVGLPAYEVDEPAHVSEAGSPHARYATLDMRPDGSASFEFHAVPYGFDEAARRADANGRPEWAHALRTGFMPDRDSRPPKRRA